MDLSRSPAISHGTSPNSFLAMGDLSELEGDVTAVAHHLDTDLEQLFLKRGNRPVLNLLRQRQGAQEVVEVIDAITPSSRIQIEAKPNRPRCP